MNHTKKYETTLTNIKVGQGAQWLRGKVLDVRPRGQGFQPHWHHCIVSLSKNINPSLEEDPSLYNGKIVDET